METAAEYLKRTRSSAEHLFRGIQSYISVLHEAETPIFVFGGDPNDDETYQREAEQWYRDNEAAFKKREEVEERYFAESFAQANLCGALLQVAYMGLSLYGVERDAVEVAGQTLRGKASRFCVGRAIRSLPQGLLILAGRNQCMHLEDETLRPPNDVIFEVLATHSDDGKAVPYRDPAFDLRNEHLISYAHNITALMRWRAYEPYEVDMRMLLGC